MKEQLELVTLLNNSRSRIYENLTYQKLMLAGDSPSSILSVIGQLKPRPCSITITDSDKLDSEVLKSLKVLGLSSIIFETKDWKHTSVESLTALKGCGVDVFRFDNLNACDSSEFTSIIQMLPREMDTLSFGYTESNKLGELTAVTLINAFGALGGAQIEKLDLSRNQLSLKSGKELADIFNAMKEKDKKTKPTLVKNLDLGANNLGSMPTADLIAFFESLKGLGLMKISLANNELEKKEGKDLAKMIDVLVDAGVSEFELYGTYLEDINEEDLFSLFERCRAPHISLDNAYKSSDYWKHDTPKLKTICTAIKNSLITSLSLNFNNLSTLDAEGLMDAFSILNGSKVTHISLCGNSFGDMNDEMLKVFRGIKLSGVTHVNLSNNSFEKLSSEALINAFGVFEGSSLKHIDLANSGLAMRSVDELKRILEAIPKSITSISFCESDLKDMDSKQKELIVNRFKAENIALAELAEGDFKIISKDTIKGANRYVAAIGIATPPSLKHLTAFFISKNAKVLHMDEKKKVDEDSAVLISSMRTKL